ncbi:hypothetical protein E4T44_00252 [Aureobasidium sp. EXF-8845]|nr:hypothetical protein E4T44_00252 [Aureobasidium sp. EXF-8845]KAI4858245.1 hypothetical protein E4T45_00235 [Aureobasidium sp. EXF-8846]
MNQLRGLRLLSLPKGILAMICADNDLSADDLGAMRLTNKELHGVTTIEFAQRYFRDPFVMMLKGSLETLVEICKHPVFGPQVRKIQLLNNFFNPGVLQMLAGNMGDAYRTADTARLLSETRRFQSFADLVTEQYDLLGSGTGLRSLREVFEILGARGKSVAVASKKFNLSYPPIGWLDIAKNFCDDQDDWILARACACSVYALEIGVDSNGYDTEERLAHYQVDSSLLLGLQELEFHFQLQTNRGHHNSFTNQYLLSLLLLMPGNLKSLVVSSDAELWKANTEAQLIYAPPSLGLCPELSESIQSTALETFHVSRIFSYQNDLLRFLDAQRSSLKRLTFGEVYLLGDWDQILHHVAENLSLEYFNFSKARKAIATGQGWRNQFFAKIESWCSGNCEVKNKDDMRQEIEMFIELQKAEEGAKQVEHQAQPGRQARLRAPRTLGINPTHRSRRIAGNKP